MEERENALLTVEYQMDYGLFRDACRASRQISRSVVNAFILFIMYFTLYVLFDHYTDALREIPFYLFRSLFYAFFMGVMMHPLNAHANRQQRWPVMQKMEASVSIQFFQENIAYERKTKTGHHLQASMPYSAYKSAKEYDSLFLLCGYDAYENKRVDMIIDNRSMRMEEKEALREILRKQYGKKYKQKLKHRKDPTQ
ncbi:MAG: YcxB family protein [Oscillospiraceae bacterium]|nr:YcxB family protein [Oscillospiraceae bacterium]